MEEHKAERYPFDFAAIQKGDIIPIPRLEEITQLGHNTKAYDLALRGLCDMIEKCCKAAENPVMPVARGGEIHILEDLSAMKHIHRQHKRHMKGIYRNAKRQVELVDPSAMTPEQQRVHEHNIMVQSRIAQSIRSAARDAARIARHTPKFIESPP